MFVSGQKMNNLASVTNSNINSGPQINKTGRTEINTASALTDNDHNLHGDLAFIHNIKRHDICLTTRSAKARAAAYTPVFSTDYTNLEKITTQHAVDNTMATYYKDLGDARNNLEYFLAKHQISFYSDDPDINERLLAFQSRLTVDNVELRRKNAIKISENAAVHVGVAPAVTHVVIDANKEMHVSYGGGGMSENLFGELVWSALKGLAEREKIVVLNNKKQEAKPEEMIFAGIALTDAAMNPKNGDTAVTLNHYGAITIDNGPGDIVCGDLLCWVLDCEMDDFDAKGNRHSRNVLTMSILYAIVMGKNIDFTSFITRATVCLQNKKKLNDNKSSRPQVPGQDDRNKGKFKRIRLMPVKRSFQYSYSSSIEDQKRIMGKAISSALPSHRVDVIIGASNEM